MKICIVLGPFQPMPPTGFGAVEKVWWQLGRSFASRGHQVTIIGRRATGTQVAGEVAGINVIPLSGFNASGRIAFDLLKDLLYAVQLLPQLPRSDIIVTNTFWAPVVLAPFKKRVGRIVVHVARFPKGQMWMYRGAHAIQAISSAVGRAIKEQAPSVRKKVRVLGYPVDLAVFSPQGPEAGIEERRAVVYAGRVHPEKGVHLLLEAFRRVAGRVQEACLEIIGPTSERQGGGGVPYLQKLRSAAEGLRVEFHPPIADERELAAAYRRAGCFCYPSLAERGEALGRSVLEAMATGAPCIVSALECFEDFVRHEENALVFDHRAPDAASRLADALCVILRDRDYAVRLGSAASAQAKRFSVDRMADEYLRMFEAAIE